MSELIDGTNKRPDGSPPLPPVPTFAAGDPVPGLSSWLLDRKLGGGGFGEVWLARHALRDEPPRAVKFCLHPEVKTRLVTHEKNVVARVMKYAGNHPNVVPLLEYSLDGEIPWLMYEFVEGGTLAGLIEQWKALPLPKRLGRAVRVLHAVAGALGALHRLDPPLVHRDMKPHNVLMAGSVPRITDFGIGSVVAPTDGATGGLTALAARLPSLLHNAGTRMYAPAEQMLGAPPHPREDVYALGIIAYQMVMADLTTAPGADATLELRDLKVPNELTSLIVRSVAVNPDRRPKDATEWASALAGIVEKAQKKPETATSGVGSRPVPLPDPAKAKLPLTARGSAIPLPPSEPAPVARPVRPEPKLESPGRRKGLAVALGGGLLLALVVAVVLMALLSGKQSNPTQPESKVATNPKPVETRDIEIAPGVKMTFCRIPASGGEVQLGSPKVERDFVLKAHSEPKEPEWLASEAEDVRGKFKTDGFWMGKYEVTQAEWKAVMSDYPSYFNGTNVSKQTNGKVLDTSRFPVEQVSWDRIRGQGKHAGVGFLDRIDHGGIRRALGTAAKFRLPTENEWEYACRGGQGNGRAFFWGDALNGTQANCSGLSEKGPFLNRTCAVDATDNTMGHKYEVHPWGLMHMHGNVMEWCEDYYHKASAIRTLRGGAWNSLRGGVFCRAAGRGGYSPYLGSTGVGFRLAVSGLP